MHKFLIWQTLLNKVFLISILKNFSNCLTRSCDDRLKKTFCAAGKPTTKTDDHMVYVPLLPNPHREKQNTMTHLKWLFTWARNRKVHVFESSLNSTVYREGLYASLCSYHLHSVYWRLQQVNNPFSGSQSENKTQCPKLKNEYYSLFDKNGLDFHKWHKHFSGIFCGVSNEMTICCNMF